VGEGGPVGSASAWVPPVVGLFSTMSRQPESPHPSGSRVREARYLLLGYAAGWIALVAAWALFLLSRGASPASVVARLPRILRWISRDPLAYLIALAPYVGFLIVRSHARAYRRGGVRGLVLAFASRVVAPAALLSGLWLGYRAYRFESPVAWNFDARVENTTGRARGLEDLDGKVRGVNLVAGRRAGEEMLAPLLRDNVEWIAVSPFGWQERRDGTEIRFHPDGGPFSESDSGIVAIAAMAHAKGMKLMLKPHLWILDGTGGTKLAEVGPRTEEGWRAWFASYREFLFHYAALAERAHIDCLCVGAELTRASTTHPGAWRSLIAETRRVYRGYLTYAANWSGEAEKIAFWDALDAIGIQAYYPLAPGSSPGVDAIRRGWRPVVSSLAKLHARWGKVIVFTEVGWKSTDDTAERPWEWTEDASQYLRRVSTRAQADAYEAFFESVWYRPWFAGAFIWKWYARHAAAGGPGDIDFTPQGKPAEAVLARGFGPPP
jgi:hypothetical protein